MISSLPVARKLSEIRQALCTERTAVIHAEPGAGKTVLVPQLCRELCVPGRVILVEPRRIAARAAAAGICAVHGLTLGRECGFAVRGEKDHTSETGILAVTPGVLLQMLQSDMALTGVSALIFDEFHERSCEADMAFTLALDVRAALREDLLLCVMSATLDAGKAGEFLSAPVIHAPGRSFPVEIFHRNASPDFREVPAECARAVLETLDRSEGDMLVFLPGAEEIRRCRAMLEKSLPADVVLLELHGSLPFAEQKKVLASPAPGAPRRIILATNVAESSLTISGIRCVVDSGWEKVPVFRPGTGMTFLEPRRITRASAIQRAGRAGRTAPGIAVRCYDAFQESAFVEHAQPEILSAELSRVALTLANWGAPADTLRWLDPPPPAALAAAQNLLRQLGLMDEKCRLTAHGRRAAAMPVEVRQAAMLLHAPENMRGMAAQIAALLEEKDDSRAYAGADLRDRLQRWREHPEKFPLQRGVLSRLRQMFPGGELFTGDPGRVVAAAFPEWVGKARQRHGTEFQLAGGRAARLRDDDPLRGAEFLAVAKMDVAPGKDAVIRLAVPVDEAVLYELFAGKITFETVTLFDSEKDCFSAAKEERLGALVLSRTPCPVPETGVAPALLREALRRRIALPPPDHKAACALVARVRFGRNCGMTGLPDWSEETLRDLLPEFAAPFLKGVTGFAGLKKAPWYEIFLSQLDYSAKSELDRLCPEFFTAPTGMRFAIDYSGTVPVLAIPVQQLYGVKEHPCAGANRTPLQLQLLSPARRPVQITSDLPGFWRGSWALVVKEMRARYPKHEWADDPAEAAPMRHSVRNAKANQ